ncbi:uncharacterized protein LOC109839500 isoform X3 [Asparagus officinalis]|uniref:uncharacterized protein LOC109839500 isoform X3 n=1 Tax=Asparagus officinalis TaxID=4686 RepID=UPI00098E21E4|nr:uncharacterized protein LOC109839500 isoform X3 [Asparagus officinalis]
MDYDENDFQSQNFQLVGDENKFPPSLRSFALPKFDFDEHLQVHLRFDSIADTDVLLGIQGQDNNWIEDFSSGTSALEFSSSAADNCSITRHNNVWSEATSSESVEMLLRSVGEDEMNDKKVTPMEADAQNVMSGRDSASRKVDDEKMTRDIILDDPSVPPGNFQINLLGHGDANAAQSEVQGVCQLFSNEISGVALDASSVGKQFHSDKNVGSEQCKIGDNVSLPSDLHPDDAQNRRNQMLRDAKGNEQLLQSHEVETHFCSRENTSFLEPTKNPFVLMNENVTGFSEKPDGLLEAITYQAQALSNENKAGARSSMQVHEIHSLETERERIMDSDYVDISKEDVPKKLTDYNDKVIGNTVETAVEGNVLAVMDSEMQRIEQKDESSRKFNNLRSQTSDPGFLEKSVEPKIMGDVEESGSKLIASENVMLDQSPLSAVLNNDEAEISSSVPKKVHRADESSDVRSYSPEPSNSPGTNNPNNGDTRKLETAISSALSSDGVGVASVSKDKSLIHEGSAASDLGLMGVGQSFLDGGESQEQKQMSPPKLHQQVSIYSDVKEAEITGTSSASLLKNKSDAPLGVEPVIPSDSVVSHSSPPKGIAQDVPVLPGGKLTVLDKRVDFHQSQHTSTTDVPERKEGPAPSQISSEFIRSDEKKAKISASSSITKSEAKVSVSSSLAKSEGNINDRPFVHSDIGESSPLSNRTKPKTTLVEHTSSCVEDSVVANSELPSLADKPITHEEATAVGGNLVTQHSSLKGKDNPDKSEASSHENKEMMFGVSELNHGEGQPLRETLLSATPVNSGLDASTLMPGTNAEAQMAAETGKPSLPESSCGSPTVIGCSGHSQEEPEGRRALTISHDSKESTASDDDRSFTFKVGRVEEPSEKEAGSQWKPFPSPVQSSEPSQISKETRGCHSESVEGKHQSMMTKAASGDRTNHAKGPSSEKVTTRKGRVAKGTVTRRKSTDSVEKLSSTYSTCGGTVSSGIQLEEIQPCMYAESNHVKTSGSPIVQSSSLPDLNSSTSVITLFHQPFTDSQQVQLRAQIFVYGSLIQAIPPDEACMQSAFGDTADGGRSAWESVWRKSVDRQQNQKSPFNSGTPLHSHSAVQKTEQATKCSSLQGKGVSTTSRSVSKAIAPGVLNSTPPLPSPLWSVSNHDASPSNLPRCAQLDFNQPLSPLDSYPSSQKRKLSSSMPRLPHNDHPGPWAVSAQSPTLNAAIQYSTVPVVETVQATPVKDMSMPHGASVQLVPPSPLMPAPSTASASPGALVHLETHKKTVSAGNSKNASSVQKSRKKKKAAATEDFTQNIPFSQSYTEPASFSSDPKTLPSTPPGLPLSSAKPASDAFVPKTLSSVPGLPSYTPSKFASQHIISANTNISPTQYQVLGSDNTDQRVIFSAETCNKFEQAKLQAEDAAAVAASVVSHSQSIWNQLSIQSNSGLVKEVEEKLASAAVAAAAAVSVAKAAAMAAKVASDAALQAKMLADEALDSANTEGLAQNSEVVFDGGKSLARLTPGSILKGKDKTYGSSSIISAAREATRRRVEAASAATKRAENLDAIMKAAELAAEAVSQVGTIIAMGDPLPFKLSELVEAGPEGCLKAHRLTSTKLKKASKLSGEEHKDLDHRDNDSDQTPCNNRELQRASVEAGIFHDEQSIHSGEDRQGLETGGVPSNIPNDSHERCHSLSKRKENAIQKGSVVEVMPDEEGLKGGWFSARVLDVKDNKAHVCYNNLLSDDGSDQLKEWLSLSSESSGVPKIRIAHPMIATKYDRTKKRRREAVGNYVWAVGDRVDAHMRDGWWEGIVTEKSQVDETKLTVYFPAGGDSSLVRAWDLRPSLTWKDGQWIEWSRAKEDMLRPYEGDTPQEKRRKLVGLGPKADTELYGSGIDKQSSRMPLETSGKAVESGPLNLSAKDAIFSVGKNVSEANISDAPKMKHSGLQKEGSRVVIGVPKPGKKRKFMEVSKHYMSDKTVKTSQGNDSLKFAKYLMPQASRPWRNTSKVDSKGNQAGNSKSLGVRSVKSQATQTRSTIEKEYPSLTTVSASNSEKNSHGSLSNTRAGFSKENVIEKNSIEAVSLPTTESLVSVSSVQSRPTIPASRKKSSSAVEAGRGVKGRVTPSLDKSTRIEKKPSETHEKAIPGAIEPRRSNRKIQPTSRLLEGLQSSLLISKIPTFSHDKGSKALHRSSSSRGPTRG